MRIIRYMAPDTRAALRGIREQLGDDAVILSSKRTPEGVEVTAAIDFDASRLEDAAVQLATAPPGAKAAAKPPAPPAPTPQAETRPATRTAPRPAPVRRPVATAPAARAPAPVTAPAAPAALARPAAKAPAALARAGATAAAKPLAPPAAAPPASVPAVSNAAMDNMSHELKIMRRMLEAQLEQLAWSERTRRTPVIAELLRELTEIGISQDLAARLAEQLPDQVDLATARRFAIAGLSQYLQIAGPRWQEDGGRVALVGATGAGKTTTLAKLAVRWVLRHGPRELALVAADSVRIGAQDQLQSLGQLLGVPVFAPDGFAGLSALLAQLGAFRLVLIDTPGTSVRDPQLGARLSVLANSASQLESALVLPANTQAGAIDEAVKRFAPANPACCVLTKTDESASLGGVLSVLIRARLPVAYVSSGQRVPEDLQPARALELVSQAVQLAKTTQASADEDLLRRRFGRTHHGIA
ncbi:MAG TPA: flagellar biosynthesis protein FlhF [Steroidobacteraceae bacterium]|jgi:flagellar biosynthesis protein FlhF|nr:flagellar biosynthesis protein FlhF [Steroidobacteraceae bacterium]